MNESTKNKLHKRLEQLTDVIYKEIPESNIILIVQSNDLDFHSLQIIGCPPCLAELVNEVKVGMEKMKHSHKVD